MRAYSEQLLLLSIDTVSGRPFPVPAQIMNLTLAGALLFDASFRGIINDDWEQLTVLDTSETGNPALDEAILCLLIPDGPIPLGKAVELVAAHGDTLFRMVWDSLISEKDVLVKKKTIVSGSAGTDRFSPEMASVIAIQKNIRETLFNDEVPDFQTPPLFSLIVAGNLTKYIFKAEEIVKFEEKIFWLSRMESLGREIIRSVEALEKADLEKGAAELIGLKKDHPKTYAGGIDAVLNSLSFLYRETGMKKSRRIISQLNQQNGFACPGCAWPNPDKNRSRFEFCENGAKNVSAEATTRVLDASFFEKWSIDNLLLAPAYWLEQQGRLAEPMVLEENATHYKPVAWEKAFDIISQEINNLNHADEAVFYASGRTSNEAAYLYQLFARALGTNNLPNSANICHEPSGKALTMSLGFGKSSVRLEDFPKAEVIFLFGHNPGSNHPRMLSSLQTAVRKGCKIVAVNPMPEASLMGFANPQEASSYLGKQSKLAYSYLQPSINGDMALVRGMAKVLMEKENKGEGILDWAFIKKYTQGFEAYRKEVESTPWEKIVADSGLSQKEIVETASLYMQAKNTIACWCLGITHHRNSVETIREITNLMLLKGNIGRPGAGLCPVRGHSNIQGIRTAGVGENMPVSFLEAMENHYSIAAPRKSGLNAVAAIKAMAEGKVRVLISLGGNLASASPDTAFTEQALRNNRLTVMISTKLNRSHLITGKRALILPALGHSDEDIRNGIRQFTTLEDAMAKIEISRGCLPPVSTAIKSEVSIIAGMASATLPYNKHIDWLWFEKSNQHIREAMAQTISAFRDVNRMNSTFSGYYLDNPLRKRVFGTPFGKALFSNYPLNRVETTNEELLLMTIRSHDQFNTSIFGLNDRYRGIQNERRIVFMNPEDMNVRKIIPEQMVSLSNFDNNKHRKLDGYYAIPYPIRQGCVAAYFPEANILTSIHNTSPVCETPAFKSIRIKVNPQ